MLFYFGEIFSKLQLNYRHHCWGEQQSTRGKKQHFIQVTLVEGIHHSIAMSLRSYENCPAQQKLSQIFGEAQTRSWPRNTDTWNAIVFPARRDDTSMSRLELVLKCRFLRHRHRGHRQRSICSHSSLHTWPTGARVNNHLFKTVKLLFNSRLWNWSDDICDANTVGLSH